MSSKRTAPVVLGSSLALALAGCGDGDGNRAASVNPLPLSPSPAGSKSVDGRYVGTVTIGGREFFADALITEDGQARLYIGNPYSATGALQLTRPDDSSQFVGSLDGLRDEASGRGVIIGQQCAVADLSGFCGEPAPAEISVAVDSGDLRGEIRVTTADGVEAWSLDLGSWSNYYVMPARHGPPAGQFQEELAEFAVDGDVVMIVDQAWRLFFQSAHSGCTANGILTPHLDGEFNVYDVSLTIESCNEPFAYLNGEFDGLATTTASSFWDYDSLLRMWLSSSVGTTTPSAVTMLGIPL